MLLNILILVVGFAGMEVVARVMHKYVMHGFLWSLHKSHHQKGKGFFEKNDYYFLIFAIPGFLLILTGANAGWDWRFFLGAGIAMYGLAYIIVHDIIIHQRFRWLAGIDSAYIKAIKRAHKAHHANVDKNAAVSYGMLWIDRKYFDSPQAPSEPIERKILF
ncbi:MAG TPA: sterol desaturase family protein [Chitinophagales bacterium]|nr:sterol desaturase family protein [Chitinophagales bacterium]